MGWPAFVFMVVMLGLVVLLLVSYDRDGGPEQGVSGGAPGAGGDPRAEDEPAAGSPEGAGAAHGGTGEPRGGGEEPQDSVPAQVTQPVPTTP